MTDSQRVPNIRIDFKFISVKDDGTIVMMLDPERYEVRDDETRGRLILDKYDHVMIPEATLIDLLKRTPGVPVYHQTPDLENPEQYLIGRTAAICALLDGELAQAPPIIGSEQLRDRIGETGLFSILQFELANATEVLTGIDESAGQNFVRALAYEAAEVVHLHRGHPLRMDQTSFTFFFAAPSYITKTDLAVECARVLDGLMVVFNAVLSARGAPTAHLRIGIESGNARIDSLGHIDYDAQIQLLGRTRLAAANICAAASFDQILIGPQAAVVLHSSWRRLLKEVAVPPNLNLITQFGEKPKLYALPM